jgi:hypothetical protein
MEICLEFRRSNMQRDYWSLRIFKHQPLFAAQKTVKMKIQVKLNSE